MSPIRLSLSMVHPCRARFRFTGTPLCRFENLQAILPHAGVAAGCARVPACDRVRRESRPDVRRAYRAASHNRWRCASARCCSDPRRFESSAAHLPCQRCAGRMHSDFRICASAPACRWIADSKGEVRTCVIPAMRMNSKIPGENCGPLSEMIRGFASGYFTRSCRRLRFRLGHRFPQNPMHNRTAIAIQNAAQVVEGTAHVDVGNIDMPVLMRLDAAARNRSPCATAYPSIVEQPGLPEYAPNAEGPRHHIRVQHHERQSSIAFQGMFLVEADDGLLFPWCQPEIPGNQPLFIHAP